MVQALTTPPPPILSDYKGNTCSDTEGSAR